MDSTWTGFVREVIAGRYTLVDFLRSEGETGVFRAEALDGRQVRLRFLPEQATASEERVKGWQRAVSLRHPALLMSIEQGEWDLDGVHYAFLVTEVEDDRLSEVLRERTLSTEEARPVLQAVLSGLGYLHTQGLEHGSVSADSVLAVSNSIKLSSDTITESQRSRANEVAAVGDFTRSILIGPGTENVLASPFRQIVERSQTPGATIQELQDLLDGKLNPRPALVATETPVTPRRPVPKAAGIAAAAVAVIAGVWVVFSGGTSASSSQKSSDPAAQSANATEQAEPKPSPVKEIEAPKRVVETAPPVTDQKVNSRARRAVESREAGPQNWGVVAATYRDFDAATKRAKSLADRWNGGKPVVRPAKGEGQLYYVVLGSGMSQNQARELLDKAQGSGIPKDAYVTKLNF